MSNPKTPVTNNTVESINSVLKDIRFYYFDRPMTAARRMALGTRSRNIPDEVYSSLSTGDKKTLMSFHRKTIPLVPFLVHQRELDRLLSASGGRTKLAVYSDVFKEAEEYMTVLKELH